VASGFLRYTFAMTRLRAELIIAVAVVLLILHLLGLSLELYWRIWWYDRVVHIMAGGLTSMVILSFNSVQNRFQSKTALFVASVAIALLCGVLWEVFELTSGVTMLIDRGYRLDTTLDIVCDGIGGVIAGFYLLF
jgi:hypothetical protein